MASSIETTSTTTTLKNNGNTYATVDTNDNVTITNDLAVSGDVGIGSTAPASILHLHAADPTLTIQDTNDTGDAYIKFKNNTGTQRGYIQTAMTGDVMLFGAGTTERMRITAAGATIAGALTISTPLSVANGGTGATSNAGKVLQVVTLTKVDEWTTTSNSFVDVTGLVLSITPTSTSSKILVTASVAFSAEGTSWGEAYFRLARGGASLAVGTASGNNTNNCAFGGLVHKAGHSTQTGVTIVEDSPATTSAVSYSVQAACSAASSYGNIVYVNDSAIPSTDYSGNGISTITLMEIGA